MQPTLALPNAVATPAPSPARTTLRRATAFALGVTLSLCAADSAEAQWVVSAAGDGDFTNLQEAIDHAAPGDTLFVMPGNYGMMFGNVVVDKQLSILGQPGITKPYIQGTLRVHDVPSFQLQNMRLSGLDVANVAGRSTIDACEIVVQTTWTWGVRLTDTDDLLVQNSSFHPSLAYGAGFGVEVRGASHVQIVNSSVRGASWVAVIPGYCNPYSTAAGGSGLGVGGTSEVVVAASNVWGGVSLAYCSGSAVPGTSLVNAIVAKDDAVVHVRGNSTHRVQGNKAVSLSGNAQVIWSGVQIVGDANAAQPDPDVVPFLRTTGGQQPGQTVTVQFYGQAGQLGFLLVGLQPAQLEIPGLLTAPLGVAPGNLLVVTHAQLLGLTTPAEFPFLLPPIPQLAGLAVYAQGVQPKPNGDWLATNLSATLLTY
ncbi:MAG: hypothetical protein GC161_06265 [Planctomycetaceae bacterium]|nr:hypothetical protein [Planctomycetaceae bacterium]